MSEEINEINKGSFLCVNEKGKAYWGQPEGYPYKEVTQGVILPEMQFTIPSMQIATIGLIADKTYTVTTDTKAYDCVCRVENHDGTDVFVLGNGSFLGLASTDEPFCVVDYPPIYGICVIISESITSIAIEGETTVVHTMNSDLLPDNVLIVKVSKDNTADKTFEEIVSAAAAGKCVYAKYGKDEWFVLASVPFSADYPANFVRVYEYFSSKYIQVERIVINSSNKVTYIAHPKGLILASSTDDSTKKFAITVDDAGTLSAKEVTY